MQWVASHTGIGSLDLKMEPIPAGKKARPPWGFMVHRPGAKEASWCHGLSMTQSPCLQVRTPLRARLWSCFNSYHCHAVPLSDTPPVLPMSRYLKAPVEPSPNALSCTESLTPPRQKQMPVRPSAITLVHYSIACFQDLCMFHDFCSFARL
jgi:hypothetical protein